MTRWSMARGMVPASFRRATAEFGDLAADAPRRL